MASPSDVQHTQTLICYSFKNTELIRKALIAGDSASDDRDGQRRLSQVGDSVIGSIILTEGYHQGSSRKDQQEASSLIKSKAHCKTLAMARGLHRLIKYCERQVHLGPQPTTLKNTLAAIVGAVWIDSCNTVAVLEVMTALGLVNHVQSRCVDPRNLALVAPHAAPVPDLSQTFTGALGDDDMTMQDADISMPWEDGSMNTDGLFPSQQLSFEDDDGVWPGPTQDFLPSAQPSVTMLPNSDWSTSDSNQVLLDGQLTFWTPPSSSGSSRDNQSTYTNGSFPRPAANDFGIVNPGAMAYSANSSSPNQHKVTKSREVEHETSHSSGSAMTHGKAKSDDRCGVFDTYIDLERRKVVNKDGLSMEHYGPLEGYLAAFLPPNGTENATLATLVTAIGDSSALLILKQAIQSLRSTEASDSLRVGGKMPAKARFEAINHLGCCGAHLRLPRWLHICIMCEGLSREIGGRDSDGWRIMTSAQPTSRTYPGRRGNPNNHAQSEITRHLVKQVTTETEGLEFRKIYNAMGGLHRIAERLQMLVGRWGYGVLGILGSSFTDDKIRALNGPAFNNFVNLITQHEGAKIAAMSAAVLPAVHLFMKHDGPTSILQIESVDEEVLQQMPRLPLGVAPLFSCMES